MNQNNDKGKVLVGYFPSWAKYRSSDGKFDVEHVSFHAKSLTHIIYAFAIIDRHTFKVKLPDEWGDRKTLNRISTELKPKFPHLKVLMGIGGWNFSQNENIFTEMISSSKTRHQFINSCIQLCHEYRLDGIDIDWEYPQSSFERNGLTQLLREFRIQFNSNSDQLDPLLLTIATPAGSIERLKAGFDLGTLKSSVDWFHVMTYDFHGSWSSVTGHHSSVLDTLTTIKRHYMGEFKVPAHQIVMGMPLYGRTCTLNCKEKREDQLGTGTPTLGPGEAGRYTREPGVLSWKEIHELMNYRNHSFRIYFDQYKKRLMSFHRSLNASYGVFNENQWISFDHVSVTENKLKLVKQLGLKGTMLWSIDGDVNIDSDSRILYIANSLNIPQKNSMETREINPRSKFQYKNIDNHNNNNYINNINIDNDYNNGFDKINTRKQSEMDKNRERSNVEGEMTVEKMDVIAKWETGMECNVMLQVINGNIENGWRTSFNIESLINSKSNNNNNNNNMNLMYNISSIWNVGFHQMKDNGDVVIGNAEWNQSLREHESVSVGFVVKY